MEKQLKRLALVAMATAAVATGLFAGPASAAGCLPVAQHQEISANGSTFYLQIRGEGAASEPWVYEESNGIAGLQRGGTNGWLVPLQSLQSKDNCNDGGTPDRVIQ
ncbi:MAG TPA: hypothetical protein VNE62_11290 [Actinomycetota bacterium]|nr:hypothetical protein [Actinomycetota bacterium]